ncbi:MAG: hypothetical protein KBG15_23450, partial [Kofleriaceae bacterium]|nr:hypothetical protein [Kofleriaceae bacterium]
MHMATLIIAQRLRIALGRAFATGLGGYLYNSTQPAVRTAATGTAVTVTATTPVAVPAPADLAAALRELAAAKLAELDREFPRVVPPNQSTDEFHSYLPALDGCRWPDATRQAQLEKRALATLPRNAGFDYAVGFGCEDSAGTIVWLHYDTTVGSKRRGIWTTVRVSARRVERLAFYQGESTIDWMEWSNEVTESPIALVDLDGDGEHDAIFKNSTQEGGAMYGDESLFVWLSKSKRILNLRTQIHDAGLWLPRGQHVTAHSAIVVGTIGRQVGSHDFPLRYQCFDLTGSLAHCAGAAKAERVDAQLGILARWQDGAVSDRDILAQQFDIVGIDTHTRAALLPLAAATAPDRRLHRAVDDFVVAHPLAASDAAVPGVDAPLHQQECPQFTSAQAAASLSAVRTWLGSHDVTRPAPSKGDNGTHCTWSKPRSIMVSASCVAATQTYAAITWQRTNTCADTAEEVTSAGLFAFQNGAPTLIIGDSVLGSAADCSACDGPAANPYQVDFVQQTDNAVAYVISANAPSGQRLRVIVDGKLRDDQPLVGWAGPSHLWVSMNDNGSSYR